jgi:hypothetical protein
MLKILIDPALLDYDPMYRLIQAEDLPESSPTSIETREDSSQSSLNSL